MFTTTLDQERTAAVAAPSVETGPIIVATDGSRAAAAALRAAALIAGESAHPTALTVFEPLPLVAVHPGAIPPGTEIESARRQSVLESVRHQILDVGGVPREWKIELGEGFPPTVIADRARALKARAIVMGIGHHDLVSRLFTRESALTTLRAASTPVLAVAPDFQTMPLRAVLATDFSPESLEAGRAALALFDSIIRLFVVHVAEPPTLGPQTFPKWLAKYEADANATLHRFVKDLAPRSEVSVEGVVLDGDPAREILRFARRQRVELIATGSHGAGRVESWLAGSTATALIRRAPCSVLAVRAAYRRTHESSS